MNLEHLLRPGTATTGLDVVGVEDDRAQIVWSSLPERGATLRVVLAGSRRRSRTGRTVASIPLDPAVGAGAIEVVGLDAATTYGLSLCVEGSAEPEAVRRFATLPAGRGLSLCRFATISDLHLGRGQPDHEHEPVADDPDSSTITGRRTASTHLLERTRRVERNVASTDHAFRCAEAAIDAAIAWGAELLVVKGDICEESYDQHWDQAAELLGDLPIPVLMVPGNHDTGRLRRVEPHDAARRRGMEMVRTVDHVDLPGVRIVGVNSTVPGNGWGQIDRHSDEVAQLASEADAGVFVATHHQPQRFATPLYWPHGIPGPDARRFARAVTAANRSVMASSGHTHRCRVRSVAGLPWSEVAATNHYPAMWAGYRVHEGSIAQTARRIAAPDVLAWSERTRPMLGGTWALWSAGTLSDRSFRLEW